MMLNIGDIVDNRYEIKSRIGQGGMSCVFRAEDKILGREVALKVLKEEFSGDEEFVEHFKNEARAAARLTHPNIVAVYDIVDSGKYHYIAMELVEGITLKNYIAKKGVLTNKETIGIAIQAGEGIAEAHRNGIIHRDIKPQNIIISKDGKIKVADFGIAKAVSGDTLTNQSVIGSAHYIAPEQAKNGETDLRSDLYSLGITMYEMITGRVPYDGDNTVNIVLAHIQNAMIPPQVYNHDIYPALNDIILKATKKEPDERYQSAEELIDDLKQAVNNPDGHFVKLYGMSEPKEGTAAAEKASTESGLSGAEKKTSEASAAREGAETSDDKKVSEAIASAYDSEKGAGGKAEDNRPDEKAGTDGIISTRENSADTKKGEDALGDADSSQAAVKAAEAKKRLLTYGVVAAIVLVVVVAALIMIKKLGDKTAELYESEALLGNPTAEESESESEMDYTISIKGEDLMPDIIGMNVDEARAKLADLQMSMDSSAEDFSDIYPQGLIINQNPSSGEILPQGTTVYVTVSRGSVFGDLQNRTPEEAAEMLTKAGYTVENTILYDFSDVVPENMVCEYMLLDENGQIIEEKKEDENNNTENNTTENHNTDSSTGKISSEADKKAAMERNRRIAEIRKKAASVCLVLSLGKQEDYATMPVITGMTRAEANETLKALGVSIGKMTALNTPDYMRGQIAEQSVKPGDYVKKGSEVEVKLSVGEKSDIADGTEISYDNAEGSQGDGGNGKTSQEGELSDEYYYGSIDTSCVIGSQTGPGSLDNVRVGIRLKQSVDGADEYTQIAQPIPVSPGTRIPVSFKNIRGAFGVESGYVEVYNAETFEMYASFNISFKALDE